MLFNVEICSRHLRFASSVHHQLRYGVWEGDDVEQIL